MHIHIILYIGVKEVKGVKKIKGVKEGWNLRIDSLHTHNFIA